VYGLNAVTGVLTAITSHGSHEVLASPKLNSRILSVVLQAPNAATTTVVIAAELGIVVLDVRPPAASTR
jgi:hypothetical protein